MRRAPARHTLQPPQYPQPYYPPMPYYPPAPERRGGWVATTATIVLTLCAIVMVAVFTWKVTGGVLPSLPMQATTGVKPPITGDTGTQHSGAGAQTGVDTGAAAYNATADAQLAAAIQASQQQAAAQPNAQAAPAGVDTLGQPIPTAVVFIPTAIPIEQITVVPDVSQPLVFAPGSDMRPTPAPTMPYPTPLPPAVMDGYTLSADGKCLTIERGGKKYQDCEPEPFTLGAARTIADLMRTGVIPGVEVQ